VFQVRTWPVAHDHARERHTPRKPSPTCPAKREHTQIVSRRSHQKRLKPRPKSLTGLCFPAWLVCCVQASHGRLICFKFARQRTWPVAHHHARERHTPRHLPRHGCLVGSCAPQHGYLLVVRRVGVRVRGRNASSRVLRNTATCVACKALSVKQL